MKALSCPGCDCTLTPVVFAEIVVDCCDRCGGIWFDASKAEQLKAVEGSEAIDRGASQGAASPPPVSDRYCPRCQTKMTHILDLDEHSIWYEQCSRCGGIWLDAGEFRQFKENFRDRNFLSRARQRFGFKSSFKS